MLKYKELRQNSVENTSVQANSQHNNHESVKEQWCERLLNGLLSYITKEKEKGTEFE